MKERGAGRRREGGGKEEGCGRREKGGRRRKEGGGERTVCVLPGFRCAHAGNEDPTACAVGDAALVANELAANLTTDGPINAARRRPEADHLHEDYDLPGALRGNWMHRQLSAEVQ